MPGHLPLVASQLHHEGGRAQGGEEQRREGGGHARGGRIGAHALVMGGVGSLVGTEHGPELEGPRHGIAQRGAHVKGPGLLAHRGAAEHGQRRANEDARRQPGRDRTIGANMIHHRVRGRVQGQSQPVIEHKTCHAEQGKQVEEPTMAEQQVVGQSHQQAEHDRGYRPHHADDDGERPMAQHLPSVEHTHRAPPRRLPAMSMQTL